MKIVYAHRKRRPGRTRLHAARYLAGAIIALLLMVAGARAEQSMRLKPLIETWVCSDHMGSPHHSRPPLELTLEGGSLVEQPLGTPRYALLTDNDYALIGVDHFADFEPVLGAVSIFVSTVMVDKTTGNFAVAVTVGDRVTEHRSGRCRKFEQQATPPADKALALGK